MKMEEYLNKVTEQMRCKKARASVAGELKNHILDQMEAYKQEGLEEEEALDKAIIEMGDPVQVGVSFDRIHRPQISWSMLILMGVISIFSILLQVTLRSGTTEYVGHMAERQIVFILAGYLLMLLVYYLDYSFLGKYAVQIGGIFLAFMILTKPFRIGLNGMNFIMIGRLTFFVPFVMCLFVPVFGAILFQYRGEGYRAIGKSIVWMAIATAIVMEASLPYAVLIGVSMLTLFVIAVEKEWFKINQKKVLGITGIGVGLLILLTILFAENMLKNYQVDRIKAFISQSGEQNYMANMAKMILQKSSMIGGNKEAIGLVTESLSGANSEMIFVSIVACMGIFAGILAAGFLIFMIQKIFRISFGQKNQLGMIVGCGCGMLLMMMSFFSIIQSLGLFPISSVVLPFFSNSGSGTLVFYVLMGLVLSIYRYQNIPMTQPQGKRKKLKITFE